MIWSIRGTDSCTCGRFGCSAGGNGGRAFLPVDPGMGPRWARARGGPGTGTLLDTTGESFALTWEQKSMAHRWVGAVQPWAPAVGGLSREDHVWERRWSCRREGTRDADHTAGGRLPEVRVVRGFPPVVLVLANGLLVLWEVRWVVHPGQPCGLIWTGWRRFCRWSHFRYPSRISWEQCPLEIHRTCLDMNANGDKFRVVVKDTKKIRQMTYSCIYRWGL